MHLRHAISWRLRVRAATEDRAPGFLRRCAKRTTATVGRLNAWDLSSPRLIRWVTSVLLSLLPIAASPTTAARAVLVCRPFESDAFVFSARGECVARPRLPGELLCCELFDFDDDGEAGIITRQKLVQPPAFTAKSS